MYNNNPYRTYKQTASNTLSMAQSVAVALEKAAEHASNMVEAIKNDDVERRVEESNKASVIINCLKDCIVKVNDDQSSTANMFENYFGTFNNLILRASMKGDLKSAQAIAVNLKNMSKFWYNLDQHISPQQYSSPPMSQQLESINFGA